MSSHKLQEGTTFNGEYYVEQHLGAGSYAHVYRVRDEHEEKIYAMKLLDFGLMPSEETTDNFRSEAAMLMRFDSPGVVKGYGFGQEVEWPRRPYILMEYVPDGSLDTQLWGIRPRGMRPADAAEYIQGASQGVGYLHANEVIHRDLRLENILVDKERRRVLIADLGFAACKHALASSTATVCWGPYNSPEALHGEYSEASDQFALGVIAYALLAGGYNTFPFIGQWSKDVPRPIPLREQIHGPYTAAHKKAEKVLQKSMAVKPSERFGSIEEFSATFHETILRSIR